MPLDTGSTSYLGRMLFVLPYYGHGWSRTDAGSPPRTPLDSLGPKPFNMRVEEFIYCDEQVMGLGGIIVEPRSPLDGFWCCSLLRNTDESNFTRKCGQYMIWIARNKLPVDPAPHSEKALFEWVTPDAAAFGLCGFGTVAESVDHVRDVYDRTVRSRELVQKQTRADS